MGGIFAVYSAYSGNNNLFCRVERRRFFKEGRHKVQCGGATSIENGLTTDEVSFTADGVTTENGEDIYLTYTVDYKTVPKERLNDVIAVEYRRTMYVPRNSVGDYDISATLSYTDLSVNVGREIKYSGADTDMISYSVAGDFIAFCYPLPEGLFKTLNLRLKFTL